jgi:N-acetylmuramoyl-L-alanine amidase
MRNIQYIVIHCSGASQSQSVDSIKRYWREVLGWKQVGYHWIVEAGGKRHQLAQDLEVTNGVAGQNSKCIHLCYIGGKHIDDRTEVQKQALIDLVRFYKSKYPNTKVQGHRDFLKKGTPQWKDCPQFDAIPEYAELR